MQKLNEILYILPLFILSALFVGAWMLNLFQKKQTQNLQFNEITLIVPFKNEELNLSKLVRFLANNKVHEKIGEIIFVDDHSDDNSVEVIRNYSTKSDKIKLITNHPDRNGKKYAILDGIKTSSKKWILTWDADILPNKNFFKTPIEISSSDMILLPVLMETENSLSSKIFSLEYNLLAGLNYMLSPITLITASGANLLFNKSCVNDLEDVYSSNIVSGDDHFLLRKFQAEGKKVIVSNNEELSVYARSKSSLKSNIKQRVRWIGKFKYQKCYTDVLIGLLLSIWFLQLPALVTLYVFDQVNLWILVLTLGIQIAIYYWVLYSFLRYFANLLLTFLFVLFYPFLFFFILIKTLTYKNTW